jgi:adenosylhomocysteine nucleosidase
MEAAGVKPLGDFRAEDIAGFKAEGGFEFYKGGIRGLDSALVVSGAGDENAYRAAKTVCSAFPVKAYISFGLSAGLTTEACKGYIVIGERVVGGEAVYPANARLLKEVKGALSGWEICVCGGLVVSPTVVCLAGQKSRYAETGCLALDMETAGAARAAQEAGVPFIAIRGISDVSDEDLPVDFNKFIKDGKLDMMALVCYLAMHPSKIPDMIKLGRGSKLAMSNISTGINTIIDRLKEIDR